MVAKAGTSISASAILRSSTVASNAMLIVGKPMPITPFTNPAKRNTNPTMARNSAFHIVARSYNRWRRLVAGPWRGTYMQMPLAREARRASR
ncbi:MAG: hypothetical protein ACTSUD_07485 [Alphaproteobacteria bacterium]